jgi:hypothetical protein
MRQRAGTGECAMIIRLASVVSILAMLSWPVIADAKPKGVKFGCSMAQVQSPAAAACLRQMDQDIMSGKPKQHGLYCSSTGKILCCEYDSNSAIVDHSCSVVSGISKSPQGGLNKLLAVPKQ